MKVLALYVTAINILTFCVWESDKNRAKRKQWRIPEAQLWLLAILGGGVGAFLGMQIFRHKTRKPCFKIGIPALAAAQLILLAGYLWK